jgi:hypothetical protein
VHLKAFIKKIDRYLTTRVSYLETIHVPSRGMRRDSHDVLFEAWRATGRYEDQRSLSRFGTNVYSVEGEDGIVAEIFRRIKHKSKFFVEIGANDGVRGPTRFLLEQGWRGIWVEGNASTAARARSVFSEFINSGKLRIINAFISAENVNALFEKDNVPDTFDFLSVDIDQNTSHIWRALRYKARLSCIEYNASLPPSIPVEVPYDASATWDETNWYGASLKALELIGTAKGCYLVGCDLWGVNAYFVDQQDLGDAFYAPYTAETHYEPARYYPWGGVHRAWPHSAKARRWA